MVKRRSNEVTTLTQVYEKVLGPTWVGKDPVALRERLDWLLSCETQLFEFQEKLKTVRKFLR